MGGKKILAVDDEPDIVKPFDEQDLLSRISKALKEEK